jgi:hypothetical protein
VIVGHSQRHHLIDVNFIGPKQLKQPRGDIRQLESLAHDHGTHPKTSRNVFYGHPLIDQTAKRGKLVGGMHSLTDGIFSQTQFGGCHGGNREARYRESFGNLVLLPSFGERRGVELQHLLQTFPLARRACFCAVTVRLWSSPCARMDAARSSMDSPPFCARCTLSERVCLAESAKSLTIPDFLGYH